jgi:hypothetical protein
MTPNVTFVHSQYILIRSLSGTSKIRRIQTRNLDNVLATSEKLHKLGIIEK